MSLGSKPIAERYGRGEGLKCIGKFPSTVHGVMQIGIGRIEKRAGLSINIHKTELVLFTTKNKISNLTGAVL